MALGARSQQVVWSIAAGLAGLIGVGTSIGLVLTVLVMLALRATSGSADIGIGNMDVYRPSIDPIALVAIAAMTAVVGVAAAFVPARRAARMDSTRGLAPRVTAAPRQSDCALCETLRQSSALDQFHHEGLTAGCT
jgi:ABC-type antimicrobial peptide transport system permease subunit